MDQMGHSYNSALLSHAFDLVGRFFVTGVSSAEVFEYQQQRQLLPLREPRWKDQIFTRPSCPFRADWEAERL
jgi:hypothetical protein